MPTQHFEVKWTGSVTPKATKFMRSETLHMEFIANFELDSTDAANFKIIKKKFLSLMDGRIVEAAGFLDQQLTIWNGVIADMLTKYDKLKGTFPSSPQAASQYASRIKELGTLAIKIQQYPEDYKEIVSGWAHNLPQQQGHVAMLLAVKAARVQAFDDKTCRVRAGQAIKAVLVLAAIAVSVAAIVVSAGSTAPIFIGLAAAGLAISGLSNVAAISKVIVENANMEKHILAAVTKDVDAVLAAFKSVKTKGSNLGKHVTELSNLMNIRKDKINGLKNDVLKNQAAVKSYVADLAKLGDSVDPQLVAAKQKKAAEVETKLVETKAKIIKLEADNAEAQRLLDSLTALGAKVDELSGEAANTMLGNIKARYSKLDGWTDLGNTVGGLANSASGIHS